MPIEGTMGMRHIYNIGHIVGLIYANIQKTIVVMYSVDRFCYLKQFFIGLVSCHAIQCWQSSMFAGCGII